MGVLAGDAGGDIRGARALGEPALDMAHVQSKRSANASKTPFQRLVC